MRTQTRFLADAFRDYERRVRESEGCDEHTLRERLIAEPASDPIRHVIVTIPDWIADAEGLYQADFDLLTRIPGLESLDIVSTERVLSSGFHERLHNWWPGLEETDLAGLKPCATLDSGNVAQGFSPATPVLIVSHSKGCLDTLEALLDLQAEGKLSNVAGWVAIQGPFAGAPDVDDMQGNQFRRIKTRVAIKCLGACFDAVNDMKSSTRKEYLETHRDAIDRLVARLPVVCFASWVENAKNPGSDGAVPVSSAVLPATDFALVRGLSHSATVINRGGEFDRVAFTRALMTMLLDRVAKLAPPPELSKN
jgi:hypothetical protein